MEVTEAIARAEADLAGTLEALREARELVIALESDTKRFRVELAGLRSYAERSGLTPVARRSDENVVPISAEVARMAAGRDNLTLVPRSDAVAAVLEDADRPLDRAAIQEQLADAGRPDSLDDVSLALTGLKRSGRVVKLGHGLWELAAGRAVTR